MSKNNKAPFQLKPKHLIRALFLVSFIAVAALVAGVFSTFFGVVAFFGLGNNRVAGGGFCVAVFGTVEPETVQPAKDGDAKTASGNPVVPQTEKSDNAEEGAKNDRPAARRGKRTENKRAETDKSEKAQSDNSSPAAQNTPQADSQPVANKAADSKPAKAKAPESKPTPKAEPEAKPQAKPRNKDNLDNLF